MNNEEKILELLEKLNGRMENLESGQAMLDRQMLRLENAQAAFDGRLEWMDQGIRNTNHRMDDLNFNQAAINGRMSRFEDGLTEVKDGVSRVNVRLDLDVGKRLDAMAEGQAAIEKRLDALGEVKELAEKTKDKVDVIHAVVSQHSAAITEPKQVQ